VHEGAADDRQAQTRAAVRPVSRGVSRMTKIRVTDAGSAFHTSM
jgi:hypothetical protein